MKALKAATYGVATTIAGVAGAAAALIVTELVGTPSLAREVVVGLAVAGALLWLVWYAIDGVDA